jgi:hypothetical protein
VLLSDVIPSLENELLELAILVTVGSMPIGQSQGGGG